MEWNSPNSQHFPPASEHKLVAYKCATYTGMTVTLASIVFPWQGLNL
jgi:hypothetical protein